MDAVSSQPKEAGVLLTDRLAEKCSIQPRSWLDANGFSNTPMYTSPSGPTVGEAVPSLEMDARLPLFGSSSETFDCVTSVVLLSERRKPWAPSLTATYSVFPSRLSAGALFCATWLMLP